MGIEIKIISYLVCLYFNMNSGSNLIKLMASFNPIAEN